MAFTFIMSRTAGGQRSTGTLPAILEDGEDPLPKPALSTLHSSGLRNMTNPSPRIYISDSDSNAAGEKSTISEILEKRPLPIFFERRGGWRRLGVVALLVILGVIGLTVGLVFGLRKANSSSVSGNDETPTPTINTTFPAGFYRIDTALATVNSSCSLNPGTWRCYPYSTYADSPSTSGSQFDWIIQPVTPPNGSYTISSTNNPFALLFANILLVLEDEGTATERYTFQVMMNKAVIPAVPITSNNMAATCYFNTTLFEANLYTRRTKTYGMNSTSSGNGFKLWPNAASMEQISTSGPQCFDVLGNLVGNFAVQGTGQECSCSYLNYAL